MKPRTRLPAAVVRLGWISFFTDIGSEMAYPVLPLFLVGSLQTPAMVLGVIEGLAEAVVSLMKGWSGWHSDRLGRRLPYVRWGYGLAALSKPLIGLASAWPLVLFGRTLDRFGKGLRTTARDALIAQAAPAASRGQSFGFHRAMDTSGAVVGIALAGLWLWLHPGHYREIFFWALAPGLASVALTFRLREPADQPSSPPNLQRGGEAPPRTLPALSLGSMSAGYWRALLVLTVFALANSSDTFLLLRARQQGWGDGPVVGLYGLYNLSYALSAYPAGRLSDRWGRWPTLAGGWLLYTVVYAGFGWAASSSMPWLMLAYGLYMGLTEGVGKALLADRSPAHMRGTALGLFSTVLGVATLTSSLLAGWLWESLGPAAPFQFGGACALLAVALIPLARRA